MSGLDDLHEPLLEEGEAMPHATGGASQRRLPGGSWASDRLQHSMGTSPNSLPTQGGGSYVSPADQTRHSPAPLKGRPQANAATRARRTAWICIGDDGKRSFLHADKRAVTAGLGLNIPPRDMRLLDCNLATSETCKILVRDVAILFAVEHVRLIITSTKVLIPREGYEHNPMAVRFVDVLEEAVAEWVRQLRRDRAEAQVAARQRQVPKRGPGAGDLDLDDDGTSGSMARPLDFPSLPFELAVLEAALKEVVAASAAAVRELEGVVLPALDALTKSVSSITLERVRKVKTRHGRLTGRCRGLREEIERFLGDDDDMVRMCLTRRIELEEAALRAQQQQQQPQEGGGPATTPYSLHVGSLTARRHLMMHAAAARLGSPPRVGAAAGPSAPGGLLREGLAAHDSTPGLTALGAEYGVDPYEDESQEVENLLESYYMQADGLCDKLVLVEEYIQDTEEYINISLDSSRNQLIRLEIVLTAATFALAPFNLLAGILGENLVLPQFLTRSERSFGLLNAIAFAACFLAFYSIILYMQHRKLL